MPKKHPPRAKEPQSGVFMNLPHQISEPIGLNEWNRKWCAKWASPETNPRRYPVYPVSVVVHTLISEIQMV